MPFYLCPWSCHCLVFQSEASNKTPQFKFQSLFFKTWYFSLLNFCVLPLELHGSTYLLLLSLWAVINRPLVYVLYHGLLLLDCPPDPVFCRIPNMFLVLLNINCTYEIPRRQREGAKTLFFFWKRWYSFSLDRCEFYLASDWISFCRRSYIIELLWCQLQLSVGS